MGLAAAFIVSLFFAVFDTGLSYDFNLFLHGVGVLAALYFAVCLLRGTKEEGPSGWLGKPQDLLIDAVKLSDAMNKVLATYSDSARLYFANVLFQLPQYLVRVDERVTPAVRGSEIRAALTLRVDGNIFDSEKKKPAGKQAEFLLVPVFRTGRKVRIDELEIVDNTTGEHAPRLSRDDTIALTALTLRRLFNFEAEQRGLPAPDPTELHRFLVGVCQGRPGNIRARLRKILRISQGVSSEQLESSDRLEQLAGLCEYLSQDYLIVAEVARPDASQLIVTYEHFTYNVASGQTPTERMRIRFGLAPNTIEFPMQYAFQAQIYHLQLAAPMHQYVYDHRLEVLGGNESITQEHLEPYGRPYVRVYHQSGRTNAHYYMRTRSLTSSNGASAPTPPDLKSTIEFREIPPGALGAATIVAVAAAVLVALFTF
ncbi:MAG TPA: hypothetical protein VLJ59_16065, partial [Mycobacteriales bacterium]|nr:hypothetical protein [Mycobacteriales bacterium]